MPTLDEDGWQLESGVERHAEAPETFEIPDEAIRSRLVPTSAAKLSFTLRGAEGRQVERMWVHITGYTESGYVGVLDNDPRTAGAPIAAGHVVEFGPPNVVGGLGIDTSGYSIPYLASWSWEDADMGIVEACAELIDRHAKRIENAIGDPPNPAAASESAEPRDRRRAASATGA